VKAAIEALREFGDGKAEGDYKTIQEVIPKVQRLLS